MHNTIDNEQKLTMLRNNLVFHAPKLIFDVIVWSQAVAASKYLKQNENLPEAFQYEWPGRLSILLK